MKKIRNVLIATSLIVALAAPGAFANGGGIFTGIVRCSPNLIVSDAQVCAPFGCLPLSINPSDKLSCAQAVSIAILAVEAFCANLETFFILKLISPPSVIGTNNGSQYTFSAACGGDT
jgi:hypothetical protein